MTVDDGEKMTVDEAMATVDAVLAVTTEEPAWFAAAISAMCMSKLERIEEGKS